MPSSAPQQPHTPSGMLWSWFQGDPLPQLEPIAGVAMQRTAADAALAATNRISLDEALAREREGQRPYVAWVEGQIVSYGWVATGSAEFGNGWVRFHVPARNRYLSDFATLPDWRGRGLYPRLLQAIISAEAEEADRFWILHQSTNVASMRGIEKAGFQRAAMLYILDNGGIGVFPDGKNSRAEAGAAVLGLPLLDGGGAP